jgi:CubicO group peptidase (beta-lactamase class C family)
MKNSTFETIKDFKDRNVSFATAEWYLPEFQYFGEYPYMVHPEKSAAGLWTTATDYARFCVEFLKCLDGNGMILSKENAKEMLKDQTSGNEKWGLGFGLDSGDSGVFGHTGANVGFRTVFKLDPVLKSGYVILQNREGSAAYRARYQVGKLAHSVYGLQFKYGEMADMARNLSSIISKESDCSLQNNKIFICFL